MGLISGGPKMQKKTKTYGQAETAALQPGLFASYQNMMNPYAGKLDAYLNSAYGRAFAQMQNRFGYIPTAARRAGGIGAGSARAAGAGAADQMRRGAVSNMASYLGSLTSGKPSFQVSQEPNIWSKIGSLGPGLSMMGGAMYGMGAGATAGQQMAANQAATQTAQAMNTPSFMNPWLTYSHNMGMFQGNNYPLLMSY